MSEPGADPAESSRTIVPLLSVRGGAAAVAFYEAAFGAEVVFRIDDGGATFAQLVIEGAPFWLSDESPEHDNPGPVSLGGTTVRLILTVADPVGAVARAVAAGGRPVTEVEEQNGWLSGRVADPFGHHWEIGRPL